MLIDGGGSELFYEAPENDGGPYTSPPGDFSTLVKLADGTFQRTMTDQSVHLFGADGRITSMTDRNNNRTEFRYNASGIIERIIDPVGLETVFTSQNGRITRITDPANRVTQLEYDAAGNLTKVTDPDGSSRTWSYDSHHHIIQEIDKLGRTEKTDYNFAGRVDHAVLSDGTETYYDPLQTQYLKNKSANINPLNSPVIDRLVPISATYSDPNGSVTEVMLDKQGQAISQRDGQGQLGSVMRNQENLVAESDDARGNETSYTYDDLGNVVAITDSIRVGTVGTIDNLQLDALGESAFRNDPGFTQEQLPANDDGSTGRVAIGFEANFFGTTYSELFVNNNGNVTFDTALPTYTPFNLLSTERVIIAPFFADGDTRGTGTVTYGRGSVAGRPAFGVNWNAVGYFSSRTDKTNTFQLILIDRSDLEPGAFDFELNYTQVEWETGGASGGNGGLGGNSARAGYSNGEDRAFEIMGSAVNGALLDASGTGLIFGRRESIIDGRFRFRVRGGDVQAATETYTYDSTFSLPTSYTDAEGRQLVYQLDPQTGNRIVSRRVIGEIDTPTNGETDDLITRMTYTAQGLIDTVTDPLGRITAYGYDAQGRLITMVSAVGTIDEATMGYEYDLAGNRTAMIDGNDNRTEYEYDLLNRLVRTIESDPDDAGPLTSPITLFVYDPRGNLTSTTDAQGHTTFSVYDDKDRLVVSIGPDPDGVGPLPAPVTNYEYDLSGNLAFLIDPNGHSTEYRYDSRNRQIAMIDPDGGITRFRYDADDNLASLMDPVGNVTQFLYDARNRLINEIDPFGERTTYAYDASDNLIQKIDRNGRVTRYIYDDLNRLLTEKWIGIDESIVNTVTYVYDDASNLLSVADNQSALTFTYDSRNRVKTVDNVGTPGAPNVVFTYEYDDVGNVLSVTDTIDGNPGATTGYDFDDLNRVASLTQSGTNTNDKRVNFTYNALGQYTAINRYSDLAATQVVIGTDYTYDDQNRLTRLDHQNSGGQSTAFYDYIYDVASRITRITDVDGVIDYTYDDRSQLAATDYSDASRQDEFYKYDASGNRTESSQHGTGHQTGDANRMLSDGTYNYEYDKEGNMMSRTRISDTEPDGSTGREFSWDHRNRLVAVVDKQADGTRVQTVAFAYDAMNRRIRKEGNAIEHYVYERESTIFDFESTGISGPTLSVRYLNGPVIDQILAQEVSMELNWLVADHLGSIRVVVDTTADEVERYSYDSYGKIVDLGQKPISRFLYTGREYDWETNLQYNRARYYSSVSGVFLNEDPLGMASGDYNIRRYLYNHPIGLVDPTGMAAECPPVRPQTTPPGWQPYHGNSDWFHCGYEGIIEDRLPTVDDRQNECFYDEVGSLVDENHPFSDCGGTPNQYDSAANPVLHTLWDSGGIAWAGAPAFCESRGKEVSDGIDSIQDTIDELWSNLNNPVFLQCLFGVCR